MTVILRGRSVAAGYGAMPVIHDIDVEVNEGEVVALLGANGAGKTTTLLAFSGELPLSAGEVEFKGSTKRSNLYQRARQGLGFVPEGRSVLNGMSTRDNLRVAGVDEQQVLKLFPELESRLEVRAGLLSGGEQQMLTLGRALARNPRLLLADELSMGLAPMIVTRLLQAVRSASSDTGAGVLLVEQHARRALEYSDRIYLMQRGRIVMTATATEALQNIEALEDAYLSAN